MDDRRDEDEMFCPSCGERMRRSVNFCPSCGEQNRKQGQNRWGPPPAPEDGPEDRGAEPDGDPGYAQETGHTPPTATSAPRQPQPAAGAQPAGGVPGEPVSGTDTVHWRSYLPPQLRRATESSWRVVGVSLGLGLLGIVLLAVFSGIAGGVLIAATDLSEGAALLAGTAIGQPLGFMGLSLAYLRYRGLDWSQIKGYLGIRRPTLRQLGLIFGAWLALIVGMGIVAGLGQLLLDLLGMGADPAEQESTEIFANNPEVLPLGVLMMFLVVGPCEEILFRGVIQARLRERFSALPAIGFTAVFFAAIHLTGFVGSAQAIVVGIAVLVVGGLVFGTVYEYTQNLVVVSLLHGFHNSMILVFLYIGETTNVESEQALTTAATLLPV